MRVLLVSCHPRADSFCAALRDAAAEALVAAGHGVVVRDLYAQGFDPAMRAGEHAAYLDENADRGGVADDIAALRAADALVLVYPTWWYGMPAMLKGWFDRVWLPGIAFRLSPGAITPLLGNIRRIGVVTTYGSPWWLLAWLGWPDRAVMGRGIRRLCGRGCRMDWLGLTRMNQRSAAERAAFLAKVRGRLGGWQ